MLPTLDTHQKLIIMPSCYFLLHRVKPAIEPLTLPFENCPNLLIITAVQIPDTVRSIITRSLFATFLSPCARVCTNIFRFFGDDWASEVQGVM